MPTYAGADACPGGWVCLSRDPAAGEISAAVYPTARALIDQQPVPAVLTIDIPIGLPPSHHRACDVEALRLIGRRRSSVFPAPIRPAITAATRAQASATTTAIDGRAVGAQAWGIYRKVRDVDAILSADPALQARVFEVHPEVCFWAWSTTAGGAGVAHPKKGPLGRHERQALIAVHFGPGAYATVRDQFTAGIVAEDDIADAFAALWSAERQGVHLASTVPHEPAADANGLLMRMIY